MLSKNRLFSQSFHLSNINHALEGQPVIVSVDAAVARAYASGAANLFLAAWTSDAFYNSGKYYTLYAVLC